MLGGREFLSGDAFPGAAVVNETFVKRFFPGVDPVGRSFEKSGDDGSRVRCLIVGVVADAPYRGIREPQLPVAFTPLNEVAGKGIVQPEHNVTFLVRIAQGDPMTHAVELRKAVGAANAGIRVSNAETQQELIDAQTVRERLMAMLGVFFAAVALLLAGIGLYGVLNYSVLQRRREIGIRLAVGARAASIGGLVAGSVFSMVAAGLVAGAGLGLVLARSMESLFFQVKASDAGALMVPVMLVIAVATMATVPAIMRALRIDPAEILRAE